MSKPSTPSGSASWRFGRRQVGCSICERAFEDGEVHYSLLSIQEGELVREDPCYRCWAERPAETEDENSADVFWWRTRHNVAQKKGIALNLPALEALFLTLEGRREKTVRELRYLLCLILMRKRRVKLVRIRREKSGEAFEVRRPRRQESLKVWVFDFTPERINELRTELIELFDAHEGEEGEEGEEAAGEDSAADEDPQAAGAALESDAPDPEEAAAG